MTDATTPKTTFLKDYRAPDYLVDHVDLEFELDVTKTIVKSKLKVRNNNTTRSKVVLDGVDLKLVEICLDGRKLAANEYSVDEASLTIFEVPTTSTFEISAVVEINPEANTCLEGLYRSSGIFTTQCEAQGFRRITYCFDRPDVMSTYTVKLLASKKDCPILLSNGNFVESGDAGNGMHFAVWKDPFKKPTYLFALVAGSLEFIRDTFKTKSGRVVELRIYAEQENVGRLEHAMESLIKSMKWDEDVYGREYDLDTFNIVAINDFNAGAMENKGLNIFSARYVLAEAQSATDVDYCNIEGVIGHEYFHNWTGNRVTCRDWFQLSLKEGFTVYRDQEFSADMNSRPVQRIGDVVSLVERQFPEDAGPTAHPVRPESFIEVDNFYTATVYSKGAEVVRMIANILGPKNFRKGTDLYFDRHDGCAVTCEDFVKAMEDASGINLGQFRLWYSQSGTPDVHAKGVYDSEKQTYKLTLAQSCKSTPGQPTKKPFHIPIRMGLVGPSGEAVPMFAAGVTEGAVETVFDLKSEDQEIVFKNIKNKPVPSLLRGFSAPVNLIQDCTEEDLAHLSAHDSDEYTRWSSGKVITKRALLAAISTGLKSQTSPVTPAVDTFFSKTLKHPKLDSAFIALALTLPTESELIESVEVADPDLIHQVRQTTIRKLAESHKSVLVEMYHKLTDSGPYAKTPKAMGQRALKNMCLGYLMETSDPEIDALCYRQFENSTNMTDSLAALQLLCDRDTPLRFKAISSFFERWKNDKLVINNWFSAQAQSSLPGVLNRVKELATNPKFDYKNPTNCYSLYGPFFMSNLRQFHDLDGSGYRFASDLILKINDFNPRVATRLVTAFNRRVKFDKKRQGLMIAELEKIKSSPGINKGTYEIITKNLEENTN